MQRFKSSGSAQRFLSAHSAVFDTFDVQRHLFNGLHFPRRGDSTWRGAVTAALNFKDCRSIALFRGQRDKAVSCNRAVHRPFDH